MISKSGSIPPKTTDVPIISYKAAPDFLEGLVSFVFKTLMLIDRRASSLRLFYIGKSGILRVFKASLGAHSNKQQSWVFLGMGRIFLVIRNPRSVPRGFLITRVHCRSGGIITCRFELIHVPLSEWHFRVFR